MTRDEFVTKWSHSSPGQLEFNLCARELDALLDQTRREALEEAAKVCDGRAVMWMGLHPKELDAMHNEAKECAHNVRALAPRATAEEPVKCEKCHGDKKVECSIDDDFDILITCPSCSGTGRAKKED